MESQATFQAKIRLNFSLLNWASAPRQVLAEAAAGPVRDDGHGGEHRRQH